MNRRLFLTLISGLPLIPRARARAYLNVPKLDNSWCLHQSLTALDKLTYTTSDPTVCVGRRIIVKLPVLPEPFVGYLHSVTLLPTGNRECVAYAYPDGSGSRRLRNLARTIYGEF